MKKNLIERRQQAEKAFHDKKFSTQRKRDYYDMGFKSAVFTAFLRKVGDTNGKRVVDYGCGEGWLTKTLAQTNAQVFAFDISDQAVKKTRFLAAELNIQENVSVGQMTAENLGLKSDKFDMILGNAILHHVDFDAGLGEIRRVLRKGGKAHFMEPLGHNPFLNLYRILTPTARSQDEAPLVFGDFEIIRKTFPKFEHEEYYLLSLLALFWYFILPSQRFLIATRDMLGKIDAFLLRVLPFLRRYCWYTILTMEK